MAIDMVKVKAAQESLTNIKTVLIDSYDTGIEDSTADMVLLIDTLHSIDDHDALFRELRRILNQCGVIFMDPGHMRMSKAKKIIENTGLFTIVEINGKDMLVTPKLPV